MSRSSQPYEQHHAVDAKTPVVSVSQMIAAGLASAGAAAATSRFGVAGTLAGAAITTMIITGGSAVLKSYLETLGGRIQSVPQKLRTSKLRQQAGRGAEQPTAQPLDDAPTQAVERGGGQKRGFFGKLRSSLEWFRGLPSSAKRSILLKAAIPMALVFVIAIVAVTGAELVGGRTLSCMVWGECYAAADGSSGPSTSFGVVASGGGGGQPVQPVDEIQDPNAQPVVPGAEQPSEDGGLFPGDSQDEQLVPEEPAPEEPAVEPQPVVPEEPASEQPVEPAPVVPEEPAPVVPDQ